MMTKRKILLISLVFIVVLTAIRMVWIFAQQPPDHPPIIRGQLDLQDWDFANNRAMLLDGEWEFYPHTLLMPNSPNDNLVPSFKKKKDYIQVPGNWITTMASPDQTAYGSGTYRLHMKVKPDQSQSYGIYIPDIMSASSLYVNGMLLAQSGQPALQKDGYIGQKVPYSAHFTVEGSEIDIVLLVSNHTQPGEGGIVQSIKFGSTQAISSEVGFSILMQFMVVAILSMHALYAWILYHLGKRQKVLIYFSLLIIAAVTMTVTADDRILFRWIPLEYFWHLKLIHLSLFGISVFLMLFVKHLLPEHAIFKVFRYTPWIYTLAAFWILFMPADFLSITKLIVLVLYSLPFPFTLILILRTVFQNREDSIYILLGAISITLNVLWGIVKGNTDLYMGFYPIDFVLTFLLFISFWFKRYFRTAAETERLAGKLQEADKKKDVFLANTSHELRNPLHGMLNIAQTVLEGNESNLSKKDTQNLKLMISIGKRMSYTLNDLLDLTLLQEKGIRLQLRSVHIQSVASGVFDMLSFMVKGRPIRFENHIPESFPPVLADENRLIQILFNLLHNAAKFTNDGSISVRTQIQNEMAVIRIEDTGIGIDEESLKRIFQPYEQSAANSEETGGGIGLGLSICKQLVELHGGSLTVQSKLGHGSVFAFSLPLFDPTSSQDQAAWRPDSSFPELAEPFVAATVPHTPLEIIADKGADKLKILVVDDDPVNLNITKELLSTDSYEICTAQSGKEALSHLEGGDLDLIITDVMMPNMSGYELTKLIRERFSMTELPILLLTARTRPEDIEAGFLNGANDYVTKPMDVMELRARVKALTTLKQSVRERLRIEAACLQAQIQPHFLFNTLNSISALSQFDLPRMNNLLEEFGNYLRSSFDFRNLEKLVPITHELELVRSYLFIEQERFEERLQIVWKVDEDLTLMLPPLSIQPLVENAVRHGVLSRSQGGTVEIHVVDHIHFAEISVVDNGVGMDAETLQRIVSGFSDNGSGIGLRNTERRLKQLYGNGLHITSEHEKGTTVTFYIPKKPS